VGPPLKNNPDGRASVKAVFGKKKTVPLSIGRLGDKFYSEHSQRGDKVLGLHRNGLCKGKKDYTRGEEVNKENSQSDRPLEKTPGSSEEKVEQALLGWADTERSFVCAAGQGRS